MLNFLKQAKVKITIQSAILIILGILFCVLPESAVNVLQIIVSAFLIFWGVVHVLGYCFAPIMLRDPYIFVEGSLTLVVGVLIDFFPALFVLMIGLIIVVTGLKRIFSSVELKKQFDAKWWIDLSLGILILILGLVVSIFCGTKIASNIVSIVLGVSLIVDGITYLLLLFALNRTLTKIKKVVSTKNGESDTELNSPNNSEDFTDYEIKK